MARAAFQGGLRTLKGLVMMTKSWIAALMATSALALTACGDDDDRDTAADSDAAGSGAYGETGDSGTGEAALDGSDATGTQLNSGAMADGRSGAMTSQSMDRGAYREDRTEEATARLVNRSGEEVGTLELRQSPDGLVLTIEAEDDGLREGWHGAHLHQVADCSADDFTSAGGHITGGTSDGGMSGSGEEESKHGLLGDEGMHPGDLPNSYVHDDGTVRAQFFTSRISLDAQRNGPSLMDSNGSALIIHANQDDLQAANLGGSGARVLCGEIGSEDLMSGRSGPSDNGSGNGSGGADEGAGEDNEG